MIQKVATWLKTTYPALANDIHVEHLSEPLRRREIEYSLRLVRDSHWQYRDAITAAKQNLGRLRRGDFQRVKDVFWNLLRQDGMDGMWVDMKDYFPDARLLEYCISLLPFRAQQEMILLDLTLWCLRNILIWIFLSSPL